MVANMAVWLMLYNSVPYERSVIGGDFFERKRFDSGIGFCWIWQIAGENRFLRGMGDFVDRTARNL